MLSNENGVFDRFHSIAEPILISFPSDSFCFQNASREFLSCALCFFRLRHKRCTPGGIDSDTPRHPLNARAFAILSARRLSPDDPSTDCNDTRVRTDENPCCHWCLTCLSDFYAFLLRRPASLSINGSLAAYFSYRQASKNPPTAAAFRTFHQSA